MKTLTVRNALRFVVLGSLALAPLAALAEVPHTPTTIFDDNGKMFHVFPVRLGDLPPLVDASGLQAIIDGSSAANPSGRPLVRANSPTSCATTAAP